VNRIIKTAIAAAAVAAPLALAAGPAHAAVGDNLVTNGGFDSTTLDAQTEFAWADPTIQGTWGNHESVTNSMYHAGMYTIASNPRNVHENWAEFAGDDAMMIVNGKDNGETSLVWAQDVTLPDADSAYTFSMTATNVLPQDGIFNGAAGARLTVFINGESVGEINLTDEAAGVPFAVETGVADTDTARIEIFNNTAAYHGNDFAIDDISLTQVPCDRTSHGVWHVWTGGQTAAAPAVDDPNWNAVSGDPQSANHRYENHMDGKPYFVSHGSKGKGDWFLWTTETVTNCATS
jgi:hypothetical protein